MITTVSLNPSIDRTLTVENFKPGGLNRVLSRTDVAAGKGINVALTVSGLGLDSECVGFMYRDSAPLFEIPFDGSGAVLFDDFAIAPEGWLSLFYGVLHGYGRYADFSDLRFSTPEQAREILGGLGE